ncbi:MAG: RluA family pseudouridine synthase [Candidatus Melainabacteria bacterium]|nr:RluA family pseudouridine synthase [Candidatus Melainabacteria bacterium]
MENDIASDTITLKVEKPVPARSQTEIAASDDETFDEQDTEEELALPARLDQYLLTRLPGVTRSRIQQLIEEKKVLVNGKSFKPGQKVKGGEEVTVAIGAPEPIALLAEDLDVEIVFEDEELVVVNKKAGMITHPGAGVFTGTLVNALLSRVGPSLKGINGTLRPGIVHRLDKDTSGLLVVAKSEKALHHLQKEIKERKARRVYFAVVEGLVDTNQGTINLPIGRHPTKRKEMWVVENGRPSCTHYQVLTRSSKFTLLKLTLETGRTHQIRVHTAYSGFPVVGDIVYNRKTTGTLPARHKLGLSGHALHAAQLAFTHPTTGVLLEFQTAVPEDMQSLIDRL